MEEMLKERFRLMQGPPGHLTPGHVSFMRTAVARQDFRVALPIAEMTLTSIAAGARLSPVDVLLYYYMCGVVFTAVRDWPRAAGAYTMVRMRDASSGDVGCHCALFRTISCPFFRSVLRVQQ